MSHGTRGPEGGMGRRMRAVLLGTVGALLLAELSLHMLDVAPPRVTTRMLVNRDEPSVRYHCYPDDPRGEFVPLPGRSHSRGGICISKKSASAKGCAKASSLGAD